MAIGNFNSRGNFLKLSLGAEVGKVQEGLKKDGIEKLSQSDCAASIFDQIAESIPQEENNTRDINYTGEENPITQPNSTDIDTIVQNMMEEVLNSVKDIVEDAVSNGNDPNKPDWKNSQEVRDKIKEEKQDKMNSHHARPLPSWDKIREEIQAEAERQKYIKKYNC